MGRLEDELLGYTQSQGGKFEIEGKPLADHSVLGEVLDDWITDLETEDIYMIPKLLEKMKKFKESISL